MNETITCEKIIEEAIDYLLSFDKIDGGMIDEELEGWNNDPPNSLESLLKVLLKSSRERRGMEGIKRETIDKLEPYLNAYNPTVLIDKHGDDSKSVFETIRKEFNPDSKMRYEEGTQWYVFSHCVLYGSRFLRQFRDFEDFDKTVQKFAEKENIDIRASLPIYVGSRIYGIGFGLACEFLKESGYPQYAKPDRHLKKIFKGMGISDPDADDFQVFRDIIGFSKKANKLPYEVDKIFWIIGNRNFPLADEQIWTDKEEFIKRIRSKFGDEVDELFC